MTAVMRAMPQVTGPKVLRIGLVQGGKVIEERVIKQRSHVTIGPSEKSMFVVPSQAVPPNFRLFELIGNEYHLNFLDGMTGRIALQTGITDLDGAPRSSQALAAGRLPSAAHRRRARQSRRRRNHVPLPVRRAAAGAAEAAAARLRQGGALQPNRLDDDDHRGLLVPLSLRHGRRHLLGLDGPRHRRRAQHRGSHRFREVAASAAPHRDADRGDDRGRHVDRSRGRRAESGRRPAPAKKVR